MTVGELRDVLKDLPDDRIVVASIDPEGNGFRVLWDYSLDMAFHDGEVGYKELTPELEAEGYDEDDVFCYPDAPLCFLLWP